MWLCTRLGFFSIVQKPRGTWQVRARARADLDRLCRLMRWPPRRLLETPGDYRWRLLLRAEEWPELMLALARTVDYPNFKAAIGALPDQAPKLPAYHDFWAALVHLQQDSSRPAGD